MTPPLRFQKHDFTGCPAVCVHCEMPLLTETENDDCELATISLLKKQLEIAMEALKQQQSFIQMVRHSYPNDFSVQQNLSFDPARVAFEQIEKLGVKE